MVHADENVLSLCFKGSRNYLHSTDIHFALVELARRHFGADAFLDSLIIRKPFRSSIQVLFDPPATSSGSFGIRDGVEHTIGWLVPTNLPVQCRLPFDSSPLITSAVQSSGSVKLSASVPGHRTIDVIIGLAKLLACQVQRRHWWLGQMNFEVSLTDAYPIEVRTRCGIGSQCIVMDVMQADRSIGSVRLIIDNSRLSDEARFIEL